MSEDNTLLVEEMLRTAPKAEEPGHLKQGKIIPDGSKEIPLGVTQLQSAGYVYIYDTVTGEQSLINRNMVHAKLKQTRPDGTFIFSLEQKVKPARGTCKCLLHPDLEDRAYYDTLGLPVCKKSNLTSPFQVERHMQKRHHQEWETIKNEKERKEKEADKEFQRAIMGMANTNKPVAAKETVKPLETKEKADSGTPEIKAGTCPDCGKKVIDKDGVHLGACSKRPE